MRALAAALMLGATVVASVSAAAKPAPREGMGAVPTVFLVRHAEKVDESRDPDLSAAGRRRAEHLRRFFADAGVTHTFCTQYKRTAQTLLPTSNAVGRPCLVVRAEESDALAARLRALRSTDVAVVAGHSNTLAVIAEKLGAPKGQLQVAHHHYDDVVLLKLTAHGAQAIRLHTGPANPPPRDKVEGDGTQKRRGKAKR